MRQDSFAANIGSEVSTAENHKWLLGGQLGLSVSPHERSSFIFALEVLKPTAIDSDGPTYPFSSSGVIINPLFVMELAHSVHAEARYFFGLAGGLAQVNMDTEFANYTEKIQGSAINGYASLGMERHFVDLATITLQVGYRYLKVSEFKHKSAATTLAQGTVEEGDVVKNTDGSNRRVDFSGPFVSLGFRFYIP